VDDTEDDPILDFKQYSETIVNMIKSSNPKFCIGILGEWGTGKTTLMKLVEKKLRENMFRWDYVPGEDEENLIKYLNETKNLTWVKKGDIKIEKLKDTVLSISSLRISSNNDSVSFVLNGKNPFVSKLPFLHDKLNKVMFQINGTKDCEYDIQNGRDYLNIYLKKPDMYNINSVV
jgi:predicted AAA+ superfamily ATPase